jgi:hypothetical protein
MFIKISLFNAITDELNNEEKLNKVSMLPV